MRQLVQSAGLGTSVRGACDVAAGRGRSVAAIVAVVSLVMLFGAARAEAVPSVSFKCTPEPQNCSGWYRTDVSIAWTVAPAASVVDGCTNDTITTDTAGRNEVCVADDGEARVAFDLRIKLDKTAPVVTGGQPARAADVNGWYNHAVPIAFSGSDLTSGIANCTSTTYGGPDSGSASLPGTCTDKAGNVSSPFALRAQVRRDRPGHSRREARAAGRPCRLVHRPRSL